MERASTINAYTINAKERKITAVVIPRTLEAMQELVGGYIEAAHRFDDGDVIYVNEEGLLQEPLPEDWFSVKGGHQSFAGNAVLVGQDDEGETADAVASLASVEGVVRFIDIRTVKLVATLSGPAQELFYRTLHRDPQMER